MRHMTVLASAMLARGCDSRILFVMTGPLTTEKLSRIGLASTPEDEHQLLLYINLRLRYLGLPTYPLPSGPVALDQMTSGLIALSRVVVCGALAA